MIKKNIDGWAQKNFEGLPFTDLRRTNRVVKIASQMAKSPGESIPRLSENFYEVKATYNLFKHEEATPDLLQATHRKFVQQSIENDCEYLLIEDTSEISYTHMEKKIVGLGPTSGTSAGSQGFLLHSTLVAKWEPVKNGNLHKKPSTEVIGLIDQRYRIRTPAPKKNGKRLRRSNPVGQPNLRETALWEESVAHASLPVNKNVRYVRVCDRGGDIFDVLADSKQKKLGFVIRASHNRNLANSPMKLFEFVKEASSLGSFELSLRTRPEKPARVAKLQVSAQPVVMKAPKRKIFSSEKTPNIECFVVRVWESNPSENVDPIEWFLLCDQDIKIFEQAINCVFQYASRWLIEDFHKALKSGLGVEKLQLESANRLFAAAAIMSIVALRLIGMREQFRINELNPAHKSGLTKLELKILALYLKRKLETIQDVNLAIGRLGGHLNRKSDGSPGLVTLWRGMLKLQTLVEGYSIMESVYV